MRGRRRDGSSQSWVRVDVCLGVIDRGSWGSQRVGVWVGGWARMNRWWGWVFDVRTIEVELSAVGWEGGRVGGWASVGRQMPFVFVGEVVSCVWRSFTAGVGRCRVVSVGNGDGHCVLTKMVD